MNSLFPLKYIFLPDSRPGSVVDIGVLVAVRSETGATGEEQEAAPVVDTLSMSTWSQCDTWPVPGSVSTSGPLVTGGGGSGLSVSPLVFTRLSTYNGSFLSGDLHST